MKKHFYSHLIETSVLSLELGDMDLSRQERLELIALVESNLHHVIFDAILSELPEEDKKMFLLHASEDDHDKTWKFLKDKVENIEEKIKKTAHQLKIELHRDIKEAKKRR